MAFKPADSSLFFTRHDSTDLRLGDLAKALPEFSDVSQFDATLREAKDTFSSAEQIIVIAGYPDDEGIRINGGRPGAALAPRSVRQPFYKMTPSLFAKADPAGNETTTLLDLGDLSTALSLPIRHETASAYARSTLNHGAKWFSIGGGHDYGFPDADAFASWSKEGGSKARPLIINFDAHLDVRPTNKGLSSGTPFFRLLEKHPDIDFAEIGIQSHCNSRSHFEWARSRGARILTQEELYASGEDLATLVTRMFGDWLLRERPVYISIDIDGFSSSVAPGCSQSWATGFEPAQFFPCFEFLSQRLDVRMLGVYEVSPPLDQDDRTSKLAAQIFHRALYSRPRES